MPVSLRHLTMLPSSIDLTSAGVQLVLERHNAGRPSPPRRLGRSTLSIVRGYAFPQLMSLAMRACTLHHAHCNARAHRYFPVSNAQRASERSRVVSSRCTPRRIVTPDPGQGTYIITHERIITLPRVMFEQSASAVLGRCTTGNCYRREAISSSYAFSCQPAIRLLLR